MTANIAENLHTVADGGSPRTKGVPGRMISTLGLNICYEDKIMSQDTVKIPKYTTLQGRDAPLQVVQSSLQC